MAWKQAIKKFLSQLMNTFAVVVASIVLWNSTAPYLGLPKAGDVSVTSVLAPVLGLVGIKI